MNPATITAPGTVTLTGPGATPVPGTVTYSGTTATEFHILKKTAWPKGKYTVDVSLNGVSAGTKDLEVK